MENKFFKYPRTPHLPWSLGATDDDKILKSVSDFQAKNIVVTEKLDGECSSLYRDHIHARSLDSKHHPSRNLIKQLHSNIQHEIPSGWRICGENVYACHSIHYKKLQSYFYVFAIYDDLNICLSWDETKEYSGMLGLKVVPELYRGVWNEEEIKRCWTGNSSVSPVDLQEGYVVRNDGRFHYDEHPLNVAKFVRENHVQTDQHWLEQAVKPNLLL